MCRRSLVALSFVALGLLTVVLCAASQPASRDTIDASQAPRRESLDASQTSSNEVFLEHANGLYFDQEERADAQLLVGDVIFTQQSSKMYCDSAYFFQGSNSFEAFGNVRMEQGDSLFVYGDYLYYDGNTLLAKLRNNVEMINGEVTLTTDSLDYDRRVGVGYYTTGGTIFDAQNILSSIYGEYNAQTKYASFRRQVVLHNEQLDMSSDTLLYNTQTKVASIVSATNIMTSDSIEIISSEGWYDTTTDFAKLYERSKISQKMRLLTGDSLTFDKRSQRGRAYGNIWMEDTTNKVILRGGYAYYDDLQKYSYATDSAYTMEYSRGDTLFLHADTLFYRAINDTLRHVDAYRGVRFYRSDLQGVCDSMHFSSADTTLLLYNDPIVWHGRYQISGDSLKVLFNDSTMRYAEVMGNAFSISNEEGEYYNQLKGLKMKIYFTDGQFSSIYVDGNTETIYYPKDDSTRIGHNYARSSYMSVSIKEGQIDRMVMWPQADGVMTPLSQITAKDYKLKNFFWNVEARPRYKYDIFREVKVAVPSSSKRDTRSKFNEDE